MTVRQMEYARPCGLSGLAWTCEPRVFSHLECQTTPSSSSVRLITSLRPKVFGFPKASPHITMTFFLVRFAGLMNEDEYLKRLSKQLERFQNKPGRTIRSLEDVSFDAWIKHYKKDANSLNTAVSYYSKGSQSC